MTTLQLFLRSQHGAAYFSGCATGICMVQARRRRASFRDLAWITTPVIPFAVTLLFLLGQGAMAATDAPVDSATMHLSKAPESASIPSEPMAERPPTIGQRWLHANQQVAAIGGWRSYASEEAPADLPTAAAMLPLAEAVHLPQRLPLTPAARAQLESSSDPHTDAIPASDTQAVPHE